MLPVTARLFRAANRNPFSATCIGVCSQLLSEKIKGVWWDRPDSNRRPLRTSMQRLCHLSYCPILPVFPGCHRISLRTVRLTRMGHRPALCAGCRVLVCGEDSPSSGSGIPPAAAPSFRGARKRTHKRRYWPIGLERRPGNDPGFRGCAAPVCPLHSARVDGLVCPGTPVGSRHRKIRKGWSRRPGCRTRYRGGSFPGVTGRLRWIGESGLEPPFWGAKEPAPRTAPGKIKSRHILVPDVPGPH